MICVVSIDNDGGITVQVDTDEAETDDAARKLAGLVLADVLGQASSTAIETWLKMHPASESVAEAGE